VCALSDYVFGQAVCIDLGSMGSGGSIDPRIFKAEVKAYLLTLTFNVYEACLLPHLGRYHAPSTLFTPSITHTKLTRLCLTNPVSSTTAERSFSALRTLKTFTRSTLNANRLTRLVLLHVHQDRTDKMDLKTICVRRS